MSKSKIHKEHTGTGAGGRNHPKGGGNLQTSPRPFADDAKEIKNYLYKNIYGGEGGHYRKDSDQMNYNRTKFPLSEFKNIIEKMLEKIQADDYGDATLTTQGHARSRFTKTGMPPGVMNESEIKYLNNLIKKYNNLLLNEQAEDEAFQRKLKELQKGVIRFQINYFTRKKNQARAQQAKALSDSSSQFDERIKALKDQMDAIDNPPQQNENIIEEYFKDTSSNLMDRIDYYKKQAKNILIKEGTLKRIFKKFEKGKSNEDIRNFYASKGIQIPETFMNKIRKQFEETKKMKLEMEFSEQETKDIFKVPKPVLFAPQDSEDLEEKQISSGILKQKNINKTKNK